MKKYIKTDLKNLNVKHYKIKIGKKKKNILSFIVGVISYTVFAWLILLGGVLLLYVGSNKIKALKGDTSIPKYNAFVVLSGSMEPNIHVNDVVITKKKDNKELKEGDVITFLSSDSRFYGVTVTHRIKETYYDSASNKYTFKTKGDNNNTEDLALVEGSRILGKVIFKIPFIGYIQSFLATKGGWIIVVLIPCLSIISYDILKIIKMVDKKTKLIRK